MQNWTKSPYISAKFALPYYIGGRVIKREKKGYLRARETMEDDRKSRK